MRISSLLPQSNKATISIAGLNKHSGKTVVLNKLLSDYSLDKKSVAITSIGFDGEKSDFIDNNHKPTVLVNEGTIVATASTLINKNKIDIEVLETTGVYSPLGEIYVFRCLQSSLVELVGPSTLNGLLTLREIVYRYTDILVVDGALNRLAHLSPTLCDAAIYAVGGNDNLLKLVSSCREQLMLFNLPIYEGNKNNIHSNSAFNNENNNYREYKGALTVKVLETMSQKYKGVIVPDLSYIFTSYKVIMGYRKKDFNVYVQNQPNLVAITINPIRRINGSYNPIEMGKSISKILPNTLVIDVCTELQFKGGELLD